MMHSQCDDGDMMMGMADAVDVFKFVLLGVNALLFLALVATAVAGRSSADAATHGEQPTVKRALLVTAHPDDESMFFLPLVHSLMAAPTPGEPHWELQLLCLSRGNFDGLGAVRDAEMRACGRFLGVKDEHVHVLEDAKLQDGMQEQWPRDHIAQLVLDFLEKHKIDAVFTFDGYGVSGHPNHIDVHFGVKTAIEEQHARCSGAQSDKSARPVRGWALESTNILRKYIGVLDALVAPSLFGRRGDSVFVFIFRPWWNYRVMAVHHSQFVWYRRLFVAFSRYTFINTFKPLVKVPEPMEDIAQEKKTQ